MFLFNELNPLRPRITRLQWFSKYLSFNSQNKELCTGLQSAELTTTKNSGKLWAGVKLFLLLPNYSEFGIHVFFNVINDSTLANTAQSKTPRRLTKCRVLLSSNLPFKSLLVFKGNVQCIKKTRFIAVPHKPKPECFLLG